MSDPTVIRYERQGDMVRLTLTNVTNHELREVLIGLWTWLDAEDRADHIEGLRHYLTDPDAFLSPVAAALKRGKSGERTINLRKMAESGEKVRP